MEVEIMSKSGIVMLDAASPAQPAPALPAVEFLAWSGLTANFHVTPDGNDVNGNPTAIINIVSGFRIKADEAGFVFADTPGNYSAGVPVPISITVPKWEINYEFAFQVEN